MAKRKRKVIYFNDPLEKELLNWAEQNNNFSKYIKKLIKDDMDKEKTGLDPKVIEWLDKKFANMQLAPKEKEVVKKKIDFSFIKKT
ncbi:MAG: hypothetical protein JM58_16415 [Peptococcaceae bacterium BICA1-8]|nr:MAG: hypothetical protein JM58_16415 [Peptococcaceae bacterium BICA1-8]